MFTSVDTTRRNSLNILETLYEYDDFMESIRSVVDLGCGFGEDLEWWASRTTRDEDPEPLNITCVGVDKINQLTVPRGKYKNLTIQVTDFEEDVYAPKEKFDILWCFDAFQYCINPITTLGKWRDIANDNGMLIISIPQTINIQQKQQAFYQPSGCFYHHTLISLIHMLSVTGWDCNSGFFKKTPDNLWVYAVVYKNSIGLLDPKNTTWYDLVEKNILPESAKKSVMAHGYLREQDLVLPWLDKSLTWMGKPGKK